MTAVWTLAVAPAPLTVEDRAAGLLDLAERYDPHAPLTRCLPALVAVLAADVPNIDAWWDELVHAVRERDRFTADPRGYAHAHEWHADERSLDRLHDVLCSEVDEVLSMLVGAMVHGATE